MEREITLRIKARWLRLSALVLATALVTAPTAVWATHLFDDVSDGNVHAPGISYVADKGITLGCDENSYCPDEPLTRAQMATFLYRASGNDPNTPPSVNAATLGGKKASDFALKGEVGDGDGGDADTLDGLDSTDFVQKGEANSVSSGMIQGNAITSAKVADGSLTAADLADEPGVAQQTRVSKVDLTVDNEIKSIKSASITVPTAGYVLVMSSAQVKLRHFATDQETHMQIDVSNSSSAYIEPNNTKNVVTPPAAGQGEWVTVVAVQRIFPVTQAGSHTFHLLAHLVKHGTGSSATVDDVTLSLLFVPSAYGEVSNDDPGSGSE